MMVTIYQFNSRKAVSANHAAGFSLIELLMAVAIVGILASLAFVSYEKYFDKADVTDAMSDIFSLDVKINTYYTIHHAFPESLDDIGGAPLDPWDNPYRYLNIQTVKGKGKVRKDHSLVPINSDFDLYSMGKDGASVSPLTAKASRDDIIRANDGAYIGLAEDY